MFCNDRYLIGGCVILEHPELERPQETRWMKCMHLILSVNRMKVLRCSRQQVSDLPVGQAAPVTVLHLERFVPASLYVLRQALFLLVPAVGVSMPVDSYDSVRDSYS